MEKIILIIASIIAVIVFWPSIFIIAYIYINYKLFKKVIECYNNEDKDNATKYIIITAIICLPMAAIELLYIQTILK